MKKLFSFLFLSLLVMAVASCSDDILVNNEGGEQNVGQKLSVTGTIVDDATTRVSLADGGTSITPSWEVGDKVFGFYGDNKLTYQVASVADGVATFSLVEGTEPGDGTTVHMIYAPAKSASDLNGGQLAVDLSQQDGTLAGLKNHSIMCATATVSEGKLTLSFLNQVAILGVKQFTGLKASTTYTSATFTSAGPTAIVKVEGGVLKLVTDDAYGTITATGSFASNESGNTTSTIYFAVPPTAAVAHTFAMHSATDHRAGNLSPRAVTAGKYMYMNTKAMGLVALFEGFEDKAVGTLIGDMQGWHGEYEGTGRGNQMVIDTQSKNGNHALQLQGRGGCVSHYTYNISIQKPQVVMESYYYLVNKTGQMDACFGFNDYAFLFFRDNLYATQSTERNGSPYVVQNGYDNGAWHHLKIIANQSTHMYSMYIDGVLMSASNQTVTEFPSGSTLNALGFKGGNGDGGGTIYFDDILCYAVPEAVLNINGTTTDYIIESDLGNSSNWTDR